LNVTGVMSCITSSTSFVRWGASGVICPTHILMGVVISISGPKMLGREGAPGTTWTREARESRRGVFILKRLITRVCGN
jgi:hypothetical protein